MKKKLTSLKALDLLLLSAMGNSNVKIQLEDGSEVPVSVIGKECYSLIKNDLNRLSKIDKFEKLFGISTLVLLEALQNGIYVIDDDRFIVEDEISSIDQFSDGWGFTSRYENQELSFRDLNKSWALKMENLDNGGDK